MGRARQGGVIRRGSQPYGPGYGKFRERMFGPDGFGASPPCYYCGHRIRPGCGELEHIVSPLVNPRLAQAPSNVRPVHGGDYSRSGRGPNRRCPECGLACNITAASKPAQDQPVPWPPEFIAAARSRALARQRNRADAPASPRKSREVPGSRPAAPRTYPLAGRDW